MKKLVFILSLPLLLWGCMHNDDRADAYGNFEADETIVSSEANGRLLAFNIEEGDRLQPDQIYGLVDTVQLHLKKEQLMASMAALKAKMPNVAVQIDVLQKQKANLVREKNRTVALLADSAATTKQLDDINGEIDMVNKRMASTRSQLNTANQGILGEIDQVQVQVKQVEDQLRKSVIKTPVNGTVLTSYTEPGEMTAIGKPLFKIASLENIYLRAYLSETQLAGVKIGQSVTVKIDNGKTTKDYNGTVNWISSEAEFTPKVVQTKDERVNLVYAFKVKVKNDGAIKLGMPGEVYFQQNQ